MKLLSGVCSYWQTRVSISGAFFIAGKRKAIYSRTRFSVAWLTTRSPVVGSNAAASRIIRDFEAAPAAARDAVEKSLSVIAPYWKMRVGELQVSGGRSEEKNALLGGSNESPKSFRKHFPSHGPQAKT